MLWLIGLGPLLLSNTSRVLVGSARRRDGRHLFFQKPQSELVGNNVYKEVAPCRTETLGPVSSLNTGNIIITVPGLKGHPCSNIKSLHVG